MRKTIVELSRKRRGGIWLFLFFFFVVYKWLSHWALAVGEKWWSSLDKWFTGHWRSTSSWKTSHGYKRLGKESDRNLFIVDNIQNGVQIIYEKCKTGICIIVTNAPADDTSLHPRRARRRLHNQRSSTVTLHNYFSIKFQFQVTFWNGKLKSYTARVFAWISGTEETVDDSTWSIAAVLLLAFRIRDHLNSDLLQNRWLTAAYNSINQHQ